MSGGVDTLAMVRAFASAERGDLGELRSLRGPLLRTESADHLAWRAAASACLRLADDDADALAPETNWDAWAGAQPAAVAHACLWSAREAFLAFAHERLRSAAVRASVERTLASDYAPLARLARAWFE